MVHNTLHILLNSMCNRMVFNALQLIGYQLLVILLKNNMRN